MDNALSVWQRWHRSRPYEVISAVLLTAVLVAGAYGEAHPGNPADLHLGAHQIPHTPTAAYLLVIAAGLPLAWRRRYPVPVLIFSTACVAAYSLAGWVNGSAVLLPVAALYCVTRGMTARRAVAAAGVTLVVLMGATALNNPFGPFGGGSDLMPGLVAAALFAGRAASNRRAYIETVKARAEEDARRQVGAERLRIARELHDVVAHTMATINVQAGVAAHVVAERPEAAAEALTAIKTASRDGLRELRAILHVLRQADETGDDGSPTQPAPGLAQLDSLVAKTVAAGLATNVRCDGQPRPLSPAVDLTAYRIIQESLTNVIRHAGPATADVRLDYRVTELRILVADTGRGADAGGNLAGVLNGLAGLGGGHGITGMRERAASVGGELSAGPAAGGGFLVTARLPLDAAAADQDPEPARTDAAAGQATVTAPVPVAAADGAEPAPAGGKAGRPS